MDWVELDSDGNDMLNVPPCIVTASLEEVDGNGSNDGVVYRDYFNMPRPSPLGCSHGVRDSIVHDGKLI